MAETTGGNSGATGGGSAGGSQVENLTLGVQVPGAQQAEQALDSFGNAVIKVGTATVRSMVSLGDLNKSISENAQWTDRSRASYAALNDAVNAAYEAEQKALQLTLARIDAATKFEAKLAEMVQTFGYSKTEMLAYQAAELGVLDSTKGLIDELERLTESQRQNAIQQQRDIEMYRATSAEQERQTKIQQDRDIWEHEQRAKKYSDYVSFWEKTLAAQDANDAKYLKAEQDRVDREKEINQQRDVWLNNQRQKDRTSYEQWWGDQLKQQETALQKQLALDISYGEKSLKQKIDTLQKIAAYHADPRTSQAGIDLGTMFGAKALGDVGKLDAMIKEYNETLGKHGKKLGETGEAATLWGKILDNNRIRTEAIVLAHEALQGRFTRMPGSLMVMGEYMTAANIQIGAMAGYALGAAAAIAALSYEAYRGQQQTKGLADAINRTNGFAGETQSSLEQLAHTVGSLHGSYSAAYEAATKLTASGKFTGDQIRMITDSAVSLEHTMGTDVNNTIKEFETLAVRGTSNAAAGTLQVSKSLQKLDEQYHFVEASQMQAIVNLEKEGKTREAADEAIRLYVAETKRAAEESEKYTGIMIQAWRGVKSVVNELQQGIVELFKGSSLAQQKAELLRSMAHNADGSLKTNTTFDPLQAYRLNQLKELDAQIDEENKKAEARQKAAEQRSTADRAIVMRGIEDRTLMKKSVNELQDALDKNKKQLEDIIAANPSYIADPKNVQYESDRVMAIIKAHTQKATKVKDDGRKNDLLSELDHADKLYQMQENAAESQLKLLKDQYKKGSLGQDEYYQRATELRHQELADLEKTEQEKLAILDKYKPKNANDERNVAKRRQQVVDEYNVAKQGIEQAQALADQQNGEAQFDKWVDGINKVGSAEVKKIDELTKKQEEHNLTIGKTKDQIDQAKQANEDYATQELQSQADAIDLLLNKGLAHKAYVDGLQEEGDVQVMLDTRSRIVYEAELARINNLIQARERYSQSLADGAILEAQAAAQKQVDADWKRLNKRIGDDLASAIVDGGGKGWKKLIHDMEVAFAKMVLQPILAPISASFASVAYPGATQAGGVAGVGGTGTGGSAVSAANAAANAYKALSGFGSSLSEGVGQGVSWLGNQVGSNSIANFGKGMQGFGQDGSLGSAAGYGQQAGFWLGKAGNVATGYMLGSGVNSALSGEYSIGSGGMAVEKVATAVASYFGPQFGALAGAIGGLLNRAFGMGPTELQSSGIKGTLSSNGATGTAYSSYHQDGGWFRSDKNWTDSNALGADQLNSLTQGFAAIKGTVSGLAETLGVGNSALDSYTKSFDIQVQALKEVKGSAAEQAQIQADNQKIAQDNAQKIAEFFTTVGDEMSSKLIPNISEFAQVGETASTTLQRLNTVFTQTNGIAALLGKTATQAFGGTGLSSDAARERLVNLAGGSSNLSTYTQNYASNFLTEAQKLAPAQQAVTEAMTKLGLASVTTREQFASTVQALDLTKDKDAQLFVSLMQVADAFATVYPASEAMKKTAADVLNERKDLQGQLDDLTMTSTELLKKQRDALDDSNKALFDQIQTIKAMKDAADSLTSNVDNAFSVLQKLVSRQKDELTKAKDAQDKIYTTQIDAQQKVSDTAKTLADDLKSTLDGMRLDDAQSAVEARRAAQATVQAALDSARAGKGLPTDASIKDALATLGQGANKDSFASREDYLRDFYRTKNLVGTLSNASGTGVDTQQKIIDTLNSSKDAYDEKMDQQISDLDQMLSNAQDQIDEMKGQSVSLLSLSEAMQALADAIAQANANPLVSGTQEINKAYQTSLGRAPDANGLAYWQQQIANGTNISDITSSINNSMEAKVQNAYKDLLGGRSADAAGLQYWLNSGASIDQIRANIMQSSEYKKLHSFDVGTNYIPKDMVGQLHEGEAVIPKADNRALRSAVSNNASNGAQVVAALNAVQQEIAAFRAENKAGMVASQRDSSTLLSKIKRWDGNGLPETRSTTAA